MNGGGTKKKISMWSKFAIFCLIGGLPIALLLHVLINRLPERDLARKFILNNEAIEEQFGKVISIKYRGSGSYVSYEFGKREGAYCFIIKGTKKEGVVQVQWYSEGSGIGFGVERIELVENWKQSVTIWSSDSK